MYSVTVYFEDRNEALKLLKEEHLLYETVLLCRSWSRNDQIRERELAEKERKKI